MRQTGWVPCKCKKCVFCRRGLTTGVQSAPKVRKRRAKVKKVACGTWDVAWSDAKKKPKCMGCYARLKAEHPDWEWAKLNSRRVKAVKTGKCKGCGKTYCGKCKGAHNAWAAGQSQSSH